MAVEPFMETLEHFHEHGWMRLPGAFDPQAAAAMREAVWGELARVPGVGEAPNYIHAVPLPKTDRRQRIGGGDPIKRAEALRAKSPSLRDKAVQLAREKGVVTTLQLQAIGIHRCYLSPMCREGLLVRIGHGTYREA